MGGPFGGSVNPTSVVMSWYVSFIESSVVRNASLDDVCSMVFDVVSSPELTVIKREQYLKKLNSYNDERSAFLTERDRQTFRDG